MVFATGSVACGACGVDVVGNGEDDEGTGGGVGRSGGKLAATPELFETLGTFSFQVIPNKLKPETLTAVSTASRLQYPSLKGIEMAGSLAGSPKAVIVA